MKFDRLNYKTYRTKYDKGVYKCNICESETDLDSSYSNQGNKLVCVYCLKNIGELLGLSEIELFKLMRGIDIDK